MEQNNNQDTIKQAIQTILDDKESMPRTQIEYLKLYTMLHSKYGERPVSPDNLKKFITGRRNTLTKSFVKLYARATKQELNLEKVTGHANERKPPNFYTNEQFNTLLCNIKRPLLPLLLKMGRDGGMRINDAMNIMKKDIDFEKGTIFVRASKGKRFRYCYVSQDTLTELKQLFEPLDDGVKPFKEALKSNCNVARIIRDTVIKNNLEPAGFHIICRHSFGRRLRMAGVPIEDIRDLMGHKDINTTLIYAVFDTDKLKESWKKMLDK